MINLNLSNPFSPERWSVGVLECCVAIAPSLHDSTPPAVQVTLQQNRGGRLVHFFPSPTAAHFGLRQKAMRLHGGQALVHGLNGNGNRRLQHGDERRSEEHTSELQSQSNLVCR